MGVPLSSVDPLVVLVGAVVVGVLATLVALLVRGRGHRQRQEATSAEPLPVVAPPPEPAPQPQAVDGAALAAAVAEAEADGAERRLPGLYLSLAEWRIERGDTRAAEDLLRKCIRRATSADSRDAHAKARVALGDLAHTSGDLATACEHWQIARKLFHELGQRREYDGVDARMLRNGCPTDWVLTDF